MIKNKEYIINPSALSYFCPHCEYLRQNYKFGKFTNEGKNKFNWNYLSLWSSAMNFYDVPTSPSPRRVRIFLAEKEVEVKTIVVDTANKEHLKAEFLKLNPWK